MINLERLLKLRVAVGRHGEMDVARWWNSKGQLGDLGAKALRRGFPRTHHFAQARSVFAVAAHRCSEVFNPPECVTLWRLPEAIEEEFDDRWEDWLDEASGWSPFFEQIAGITDSSLSEVLTRLGLATEQDINECSRLRRSAEGRAVQLPRSFLGTDAEVTMLAVAFDKGERGALTVPYATKAAK